MWKQATGGGRGTRLDEGPKAKPLINANQRKPQRLKIKPLINANQR
jgi:hypothetical protein